MAGKGNAEAGWRKRVGVGPQRGTVDRGAGERGKVSRVSVTSGAKRKANDHSRNSCLLGVWGCVLTQKAGTPWIPLLRARGEGQGRRAMHGAGEEANRTFAWMRPGFSLTPPDPSV